MSEPKRERNNDSYEVAIIGMSGRFPGAKDVPSLWEVLRQGKETIRHFSDEELIAAGVDPSSLLDKAYVKANGVLDGVDLFDATFFDMSPREAKITDPQHRLFLECAYEALEDAGHPVGEGEASVGVYAGVGFCTYLLFQLSDCITANELAMYQTVIGNDKDYLPTRVSYMLDLKGPSLAVQTACSSSLVAVHSACQSLLAGECDLALAGGVSVVFPHNEGYHYQQNGILSPDGHCRAFDVNSQGMVSGNGVGIVTLKRLEDAIANGDRIRAVIKGSAINNDGHQKVGYTAPLSTAQSAVIHEALTLSGVHPRDIDYIEAHGTGTALGDPIEIEALNRAFRLKRSEAQCLLGSIKTNIGHLDTASGVAGLIKTVLAMENEELPASLHFSEPNPQIDFEGGPFLVNTELRPWPRRHDRPRHAGVSSFGIGGTNAHVVLGEAPTPAPSGSSRRWQVLPLSAKTSEALNQMMDNMAVCLEEPNKNEALADTASSLAYGRKAYRHRYSVVAKNNVEAAEMLRSSERVCVVAGDTQDVTFLFPGQGTQRLGMGADLYQREAIFRREFDKCAQILGDELDFDLHIVLFASGEEAEERLRQTDVAQPALFVVSYALARQWMSWGVKPSAMLGHSLGEYVAACLAGVMQLKEALRLVVARGRLIKELPGGAMLAVPLAENEVQGYLNANLDLAAVNSARMCVISGPYEEIDNLKERLGDEGLVVQVLRTSHAFHSAMMEPALEAFRTEVEKVNLSAPTLPYISNLTGSWVTADQVMDPEYWVRHLRSPVRFAAGIDCLIEQGETVFLEIGPGRSLSQLTRKQIGAQAHVITSLPYDEKDGMEDKELSSAVGALWCAGSALDWKAYYDGEQRRRVGLPSYPFEQQKHFVYPGRTITRAADPSHWFYTPSWRRRPATEAGVTPEEIYLVFTDELGAGNELAVHLRKQGRRVVTVSIGSGFSVSEAGVDYLVGPSAMDYEKLVTELSDHSLIPQTVVHLWGLNVLQGNKVTERYKEAQRNGLHSLLWLVQTLEKAPKAISQLLVAVDGLFDVIGGETLYPEKATVMGVCRVLPQEHSGLLCRVADLSGKESPERLAEQLLAELTTKRKDEPVIAWRGAYRWVQGFEQTKLPAPEGRIKSLRQGGVYLITGGLGGVGLVLARALARNCQARLVLTTRSPFPPRSEWQQWLDVHPDKDQTSQRIQKIKEIESLGGVVEAISANVANTNIMRKVIKLCLSRFGGLHGILHAAGIVDAKEVSLAIETTESDINNQIVPKAHGLLTLLNVIGDINLDFIILQSSLSTVLGGIGFTAYAAANCYLDAKATQISNDMGIPVYSIGWDGWNHANQTSDLSSSSQYYLSPDEGAEAFLRILARCEQPNILVSTQDLVKRQVMTSASTQRSTNNASGLYRKTTGEEPMQRPSSSRSYVRPETDLECVIADIWQDFFGISEIGIKDNFFELGGHSLMAMQLVQKFNDRFGLKISMRQIIEAQTILDQSLIVEQMFLSQYTEEMPAN